MKKYRIIYGMVVMAVLFSGLWGGSSLTPLLTGLLIIAPLLSAIRLYLSAERSRLSVTGEHACHSGQEAALTLEILSSRFRPAGNIQIHMTCKNRVFDTVREETYLLRTGKGSKQRYDIFLDTAVCGEQIIQIQKMVCYDLLGLFSFSKQLEKEFSCIVYPYEARMYVSLNRQRVQEQSGDIYDRKKSGTDVSEVFALREYREGDPLQSIHWKLSGKMDQLIVREFGRPVNYHTLILLSPAYSYGECQVPVSVVSAVFDLGISLSRALLNQGMAHFIGYLSGGRICCLPVDSPHGYEEMLLYLMHQPVPGNGDETLAAFVNHQLYRQYTKVVYATGIANETISRSLAVLTDLTILKAAEGPAGYLSGSEGYTIVGVSIETMRSKEHIIPL